MDILKIKYNAMVANASEEDLQDIAKYDIIKSVGKDKFGNTIVWFCPEHAIHCKE